MFENKVLAVLFLGSLTICSFNAQAVYLELSSRGTVITRNVGYSDQLYNPLLDKGLLTTADMNVWLSSYDVFGNQSRYSASAAVYGSDFTTRSGPYANTPFGVEPMAFTTAFAENSSTGAEAYIDVDQRVIVDPVLASSLPSNVVDLLNTVTEVSVTLDARMESNRSDSSQYFYTGFGIVGGSSGNQIDISQYFDSNVIDQLSFYNSSQLNFTVEPSTTSQNLLYYIWASSSVYISGGTGTAVGAATAVVDPLLEIDPNWIIDGLVGTGYDPHGANYFIVQQESLLNPGEWIEVSREWNTGIVPVPAAVWLFGSGLIGLIGIARRKNS